MLAEQRADLYSGRAGGSVWLLLSFSCTALGHSQYAIKGAVTDCAYEPGSSVVQHAEQYRFEVYVRDTQWRINIYQTNATNNTVNRCVGSDNGKDIVYLNVVRRGPSRVLVESQDFPVGNNVPAMVHLWLVYASAPYFTVHSIDQLPPLYQYAYHLRRPENDLKSQKAVVSFGERRPRLPRFLAFIQDSSANTDSKLSQGTFTNGLYQTADYRTIGNLELPFRMRFQYLLPNSNNAGQSVGQAVLYSCEAEVESISEEVSLGQLHIAMPERFVSQDLRIAPKGSTNDGVTNASGLGKGKPSYTGKDFSRIPTVAELEQLHSKLGHTGQNRKRSNVLPYVLLAASSVPLLFLLLRVLRRRQC